MTAREDLTHRERILRALRLSSAALDDDQLARRTGIAPRQAVNQICRRLQDDGNLRRTSGPDGKIVNVLVDRSPTSDPSWPAPALSAASVASPVLELPAGHSTEQRQAERDMLAALSASVGRPLAPTTIRLPSGVHVEVDGADADRPILVECWAHIGKVKGAQRLKVLTDAFKLTWIATNIPGVPRLVLCMADEEAAAPFRNMRAWHGKALADHGVEVVVVPLPADVREAVVHAQHRQFR